MPTARKPDLATATKHLAQADAKMHALIAAHGPCSLGTRHNRFDALVGSILSQQVSTAAARTIKSRVQSACGGKISCDSLLTLSDDDLRACGVSPQKLGYIRDLCRCVDAKEVRLASLHRYDDQEVITQLTHVKGIGVWTAEMFLIFVLHRLDVWPLGDLGVKNAVARVYGAKHSETSKAMTQLAQPWSPYRSVAAWYLWRSLDNAPDA